MLYRLRSYSTRAFDPKKWLNHIQLKQLTSSASLHAVLDEFHRLPSTHQHHVRQAMPPGAIRESLTLQTMMTRKEAPALIFQHIVDNVGLKILPGLVETYMFSLLGAGNLNAVVSLVHVLLHSDVQHYKLSNELWSLLASKSCALGHHAAASLVYHEIVNPHAKFNEIDKLSEENEYIPFLLLPTALESLSLVFSQNGNHIAVEGLRQYFKRFYSNFGHRDVYQTLYISKVESLAKAGLFVEALDAFVALASKYRGHLNNRDPKNASHSLKYASMKNFKKRQNNIAENLSLANPDGTSRLFSPEIKFNDYHLESGPYWAIFDGVLEVSDLPHFKSLLRTKIHELVSSHDSIMDRLLAFISKKHFAIGRFVIACLCEIGHISRAVAIANKMPSLFPNLPKRAYMDTNDFIHIFHAFKSRSQNHASTVSLQDHDSLLGSFHLCQRYNQNQPLLRLCFRSFVTCYLSSPYAKATELCPIIASWAKDSKQVISLDHDTYQQALSCGLSILDLQKYVCLRV
ncbi:hypothetical protein METSCH_A06510 [Metschnikowia aff. pulcherrima]|uniref:Uncharacterized protein n=1 Tax=Metschnikowia aff. pulcherrima TaxID=2163413 RepID=A0A4P6XHB9_9ASCO|nr:hypothetical protein METSCH_A06510 [Metschnikowia aff. pulcherrima]